MPSRSLTRCHLSTDSLRLVFCFQPRYSFWRHSFPSSHSPLSPPSYINGQYLTEEEGSFWDCLGFSSGLFFCFSCKVSLVGLLSSSLWDGNVFTVEYVSAVWIILCFLNNFGIKEQKEKEKFPKYSNIIIALAFQILNFIVELFLHGILVLWNFMTYLYSYFSGIKNISGFLTLTTRIWLYSLSYYVMCSQYSVYWLGYSFY